MSETRDFPYPNFAFRVTIGEVEGGFQEVSGLGAEVAVSEYRNGNYPENVPQKVMGLGKTADVTLKRGVTGGIELFEWLEKVRDGKREKEDYGRNAVIELMAEDRTTKVLTWTLTNARPMKYTAPSLNGKSSDVAIEELVLSAEKIQMAKG